MTKLEIAINIVKEGGNTEDFSSIFSIYFISCIESRGKRRESLRREHEKGIFIRNILVFLFK